MALSAVSTTAGVSEGIAVAIGSSLTTGVAVSGDSPQLQSNSGILSPMILKSVSVRLFSSFLPEEKLADVAPTLSRPLADPAPSCRPPRLE